MTLPSARRAFLALLLAAPLAAQTPRDSGVTVIRAGRVFDSETGTFLPARDIVVRNGVIASVGSGAAPPAGARVVDLSRYTVLPGLIDAHTHLLYLESVAGGGLTGQGTQAVIVEGTPLRALHGAARARTFLAAGITTVGDLGNSGRFGDVALRDAIRDGSVDGPRMVVSGPGLSPEGGQFPGLQPTYRAIAEEEYRVVRGPNDAAQAVVENVTYGADVIKIYSNNTPNRGSLSPDELRAIVETARRLGVKVRAHATDDAAVWRAASAGVDAVEHGYQVADSTLALMARKGVALVPTDVDSATLDVLVRLQSHGQQQQAAPELRTGFLGSERDRLRRAVKAGVTIVAGSDNYLDLQMPQGTAAKHNLVAYAEAGLTPVQILQAATRNAGKLLGVPNLGVLKPGAPADIIAVDGDPGVDVHALEKVRFVMKGGTVYVRP